MGDYDNELAYEELLTADKWLREHLVPLFEDPGKYLEFAQTGALYGYKRDIGMKPIIIMNIRKMIDIGLSYDEIETLNDLVMSFTDYTAMVPKRIGQH